MPPVIILRGLGSASRNWRASHTFARGCGTACQPSVVLRRSTARIAFVSVELPQRLGFAHHARISWPSAVGGPTPTCGTCAVAAMVSCIAGAETDVFESDFVDIDEHDFDASDEASRHGELGRRSSGIAGLRRTRLPVLSSISACGSFLIVSPFTFMTVTRFGFVAVSRCSCRRVLGGVVALFGSCRPPCSAGAYSSKFSFGLGCSSWAPLSPAFRSS